MVDTPTITTRPRASQNKRRARPSEQMGQTIVVSKDVLERLSPAALERGISVPKLVRELLAAIADDDLTYAILDDHP